MPTTETINESLLADGWSISPILVNPGDYTTSSEWQITITRNNAGFTVPYSMGSAHRVWSKTGRSMAAHMDRSKFGKMLPGKRVPTLMCKLTIEEAWILNNCTDPATPELADVMHSVVSDADTVRHGQTFDDWCEELGYDTDSRKAEKSFNACRDEWAGLVRLGANLDELSELFQDY